MERDVGIQVEGVVIVFKGKGEKKKRERWDVLI